MSPKELLRRRPVTIIVGLTIIFVIVGVFITGWDLILDPLPVSSEIAGYWFTFNLALSVMAFVLIWRNLSIFEQFWNWQELIFLRGVLLFVFGAALGYLARAFSDNPSISLGTPMSTLGLMLLIYGSIHKPERFEDPNGSSS